MPPRKIASLLALAVVALRLGILALGVAAVVCVLLFGAGTSRAAGDADGCPDEREQQTAAGSETSGGRRDYFNDWDYFNPTHDGQNRIDDVLAVVEQYFKDEFLPSPPNPPGAPNPAYTAQTDRTTIGPDRWDLGPPDGQQRMDDILSSLAQYFHDCF